VIEVNQVARRGLLLHIERTIRGGAMTSPTTRRSLIQALALVTVLVAAACGGSASSAPTVPVAPSTATSFSSASSSPVEGIWLSPVLTIDQARASVPRRYWTKLLAASFPMHKTVRYELRILSGQWVALESDDGAAYNVDQKGSVTVTGSVLRMIEDGTGLLYAYRWAINSGALRLTLVHDTSGPANGVPDRVFQHLIYESHPFTRST
jgi:hypothetical protein